MALVGKPSVVDGSGRSHDWRAELAAALANLGQAPNGGWVSPSDRFIGGGPECRDRLRPARDLSYA